MKILLFICLISISAFAQSDSINCDSLLFPEHKGFFTLETMPESVGGYDSLQSRLVYPKEAIENNVEGKVYVIVVIDSSGNQLCARIIKSIGYGCDEEALRLVKTSKFIPGILRGKPYTAAVPIPIVFSLKDNLGAALE
jgi:protein TonB